MLLLGTCRGSVRKVHGTIHNWILQLEEKRLAMLDGIEVKKGFKAVVLREGSSGKYAVGICKNDSDNITVIMLNSRGRGGIISQDHSSRSMAEKFFWMDMNPLTVSRQIYYGLVAQLTGFKNSRTKSLMEEIIMSYLINENSMQVEGRFETAAEIDKAKLTGLIINDVKDLAKLSVAQLTLIYNNLNEEENHVKKFPDVKTGAKKVMELLDSKDDFVDLTPKTKGAGKAENTKKEGTKKETKERVEKFPLDHFIVPLNVKVYQKDSLRETAQALVPDKGITVKAFYDKCKEEAGMENNVAKGVLVKFTELIKSGAGFVVVPKEGLAAAVEAFKKAKADAVEAEKKAAKEKADADKAAKDKAKADKEAADKLQKGAEKDKAKGKAEEKPAAKPAGKKK